jgi:hypothetical protein
VPGTSRFVLGSMSLVTSIVEMDRGYEFQLPGDDSALALVADWIANESPMLPVLRIHRLYRGIRSSIRVAPMGSAEVKRFLAAELRSRTLSPGSLVRRSS